MDKYPKVEKRIHDQKEKGDPKGKGGDLTLDEIRDIIEDIIKRVWG
jgi:hypothetical protein